MCNYFTQCLSFLNRKEVFNHLGERPFRYSLLFIFLVAVLSVYIFLQNHIGFQIYTLNNFPLPIISYKFLSLTFHYDLVFPYDLNFPSYNYVSKMYFFVIFVTKKNYIYENFFKNKEKSWPALSQRKSAYIWNFSAK